MITLPAELELSGAAPLLTFLVNVFLLEQDLGALGLVHLRLQVPPCDTVSFKVF